MSAPRSHPRALTRRGLLIGAVLATGGCGLRLEKDAPLPGPKASAPSDVAPLRAVRAHLVSIITRAEASSDHPTQARAAAQLHRRQLEHLDATLDSLGASPSTSPTTSPTSSTASDWTTPETEWAGDRLLEILAGVSSTSRPMVLSLASTGLAAADEVGKRPQWSADAVLPSRSAADILTAADAAIDALEWSAARSDPSKRGTTPQTLAWLYSVRSMGQAVASAAPTSTPSPIRTYTDDAAAKRVAVTALKDLLVGCARAAAGTSSTPEAEGVLLTWTRTLRELARLNARDTSDFPGMNVAA